MPMGDNDHTHVCAHIPSLCEPVLQIKDFSPVATMVSRIACVGVSAGE